MNHESESPFLDVYLGTLSSILKWDDLDHFWQFLKEINRDDWYIYAVGETPPVSPATADTFRHFIDEIDTLLHREHREDYCGIVYVDNKTAPNMIKIYDPNNLGVVCGFSNHPPPPGWVLSRYPPVEVTKKEPLPANRRRWWRRLFS